MGEDQLGLDGIFFLDVEAKFLDKVLRIDLSHLFSLHNGMVI
jgi:hypothetical protein